MQHKMPAANRTALTILGVTNATAQRDTGSTQTGVAVMVCFTLPLPSAHLYFMT